MRTTCARGQGRESEERVPVSSAAGGLDDHVANHRRPAGSGSVRHRTARAQPPPPPATQVPTDSVTRVVDQSGSGSRDRWLLPAAPFTPRAPTRRWAPSESSSRLGPGAKSTRVESGAGGHVTAAAFAPIRAVLLGPQ
jgi:hypothetical protein